MRLAFDSIVPYMFLMMLLYYFMAALLPIDSVIQPAWPLRWGPPGELARKIIAGEGLGLRLRCESGPVGLGLGQDKQDSVFRTVSRVLFVSKKTAKTRRFSRIIRHQIGGWCRFRTSDPLIKSQLLYQLS